MSFWVDPTLDVYAINIPNMIIQPFVENAFLHGLMHKKTGGQLSIRLAAAEQADSLVCTIEDNGVGRKRAAALNQWRQNHTSKGISITEKRLQLTSQLLHKKPVEYQIEDLYASDGAAMGTKIILYIPYSDK